MKRPRLPVQRLAAAACLPLALTFAGCGDAGTDEVGAIEGDPVAEIAAASGTQWTDQTQITPAGGYLLGNPDAPIKLVEYGSLTCPACAAFSGQAAEPLEQEYVNSGRVSFEFRSFLIHGPLDLALTRLIECGQPQAIHPLANQVWANLDAILNQAQAAGPQLEAALELPDNQRFSSPLPSVPGCTISLLLVGWASNRRGNVWPMPRLLKNWRTTRKATARMAYKARPRSS